MSTLLLSGSGGSVGIAAASVVARSVGLFDTTARGGVTSTGEGAASTEDRSMSWALLTDRASKETNGTHDTGSISSEPELRISMR